MRQTIFLCEPTALTSAQRRISDWWHECLFGLGFDVEQLRRDDYQRDPWEKLLRFFDRADGVLVLGFRQLTINSGIWRNGTAEQTNVDTTWTSPWLQTETGMAIARGLPVLVAAESGVREGVFAPETWTGALLGTSAEAPSVDIVDDWSAIVFARARCNLAGQVGVR